MSEIYGLGISQFGSYIDNLNFVLGNEKQDKSREPIYDPDLDPNLHPELKKAFNSKLGVKNV